MNVTIEYTAQIRRAAGTASEGFELDEPCSVQDFVLRVAEQHAESLAKMLLDSDGALHPSLLLFVGDDQIRWETPVDLKDGDVVTVLSPISGG